MRKRSRSSQSETASQLNHPLEEQTTHPLLLAYVAIVPVTGILICGSGDAWARAIMAGMTALFLILFPARTRLPLALWIIPVLITLLLLSFLIPQSVLPIWRQELSNDFGIDTGNRVSPQPWVSFEKWLQISCGVWWLYGCMARGFLPRERRLVIRMLVYMLSGVALLSIYFKVNDATPELWKGITQSAPNFGPFPNRNHFASLCAVTGMLAFASAYDCIRHKKLTSLILGLCLAVCFLAILLNTSRAGVALFFVGLGAWMLSATFGTRSVQKMAIFLSALLAAATVFLLYGKNVLQRIIPDSGKSFLSAISMEGRSSIQGEAIRQSADGSVWGWGLGNFQNIYGVVADYRPHLGRVLHPEGEWVLLIAESGWLTFFCLLTGFITLLYFFRPWTGSHDKLGVNHHRIRMAAVLGVLVFVLHGIADVPLQNIGLSLLAALLCALGLQAKDLLPTNRPISLAVNYAGAIFCLICGVSWLSIHRGLPFFPSKSEAVQRAATSYKLAQDGRNADALQELNKAITIRPLQWNYYQRRGILKLNLGHSFQDVLADFTRASKLEPFLPGVMIAQAEAWERHNPAFAVSAYREAIRRRSNLASYYYNKALDLASRHPSLITAVRSIAADDQKLFLKYLLWSDHTVFNKELDTLLKNNPQLTGYTSSERLALFQKWHHVGDRAKLIKELEQNTLWAKDGWTVLATQYASTGDFRRACELAFTYLPEPLSTANPTGISLDQLRRNFVYNPTDVVRGLELYEAQKKAGDINDALGTLEAISHLANAPSKILYEKAVMLTRKNEYAKAWEILNSYATSLPKSDS